MSSQKQAKKQKQALTQKKEQKQKQTKKGRPANDAFKELLADSIDIMEIINDDDFFEEEILEEDNVDNDAYNDDSEPNPAYDSDDSFHIYSDDKSSLFDVQESCYIKPFNNPLPSITLDWVGSGVEVKIYGEEHILNAYKNKILFRKFKYLRAIGDEIKNKIQDILTTIPFDLISSINLTDAIKKISQSDFIKNNLNEEYNNSTKANFSDLINREFVKIPMFGLIPLSIFFGTVEEKADDIILLKIIEYLKEVVANEPKDKPYSDDDIKNSLMTKIEETEKDKTLRSQMLEKFSKTDQQVRRNITNWREYAGIQKKSERKKIYKG
ncbi:MAG: hypothetical protein HQK76_12745 [Desulfobacterales bacterium]|nr:hypothetical protein [Desulfobacterales bacterium]